jgi:hypothetical protein
MGRGRGRLGGEATAVEVVVIVTRAKGVCPIQGGQHLGGVCAIHRGLRSLKSTSAHSVERLNRESFDDDDSASPDTTC